jgi:hypothetical protein
MSSKLVCPNDFFPVGKPILFFLVDNSIPNNNKRNLAKDCEKCEWSTYKDWLSDEVPMLHQILVEVHQAPKNVVLDFFDSLDRDGYLRFHKEANIMFDPKCLEYAFVKVKKSFVEGKKSGATLTDPNKGR